MGGAKNCPETPRQKMISMMYLVLTAMLALNVSAAILNGYAQVDDSLHATIMTMNEGNRETYAQFEAALKDNQVKVGQYYNKAMEIQKVSNAFYDYVQGFKDAMVAESEGKKAKAGARVRELGKQDDTNVPQRYAINEGNAAILKEKINAYREFMIDITGNSPALDNELRETFVTPRGVNAEGDSISWEDAMFHEMPMCACITVLTKLQSDIRHCEGRAVRYLLTASDASDVRVNKFDAYVISESDYVVKGNTYRAQIILAAIDSTRTPQYYVNGRQIQSNGVFEMVANTVGQQRISGEIAYMDNQGVMKRIPFMREFTVGEPSATISNTELNVMYRGHDNPFSISVPGMSADQLDVKCKQASVKKSKTGWVIRPNANSADKLAIEVYANVSGRSMLMGSHQYRIKNLPPPNAYFEIDGQVTLDDKIAYRHLINPKNRIVASYGADDLIQAKFTIVGFQVKFHTGVAYTIRGDHFDDKVLATIKKLKQGNTINIMYIKAKGPDGRETTLRGLPIEIN